MNSNLNLSWEETIEIANFAIFENTQKHLTDIEVNVLHGIWEGKTYQEIADELGYSEHYINQDVVNRKNKGLGLFKKLSIALGETVNKSNYQEALKRKTHKRINCQLYVERPPIESHCDREMLEPGALIRIKAPQKMGKTLLLNRIIERAEEQKYQTIILSFDDADSEILGNYQKLLQWFCLTLSDLLELDEKLTEYWDDTYGNNKSCTNYLERYLLANRYQPLVLALEKVDLVFEQAIFNTDFCRLLRSWNDAAKRNDRRGNIWKQLRLIVVHSTEVYASLDIESSPLAGAGLTVHLPDFTLEQVQNLARRYQLNSLTHSELEQLMALFGGYPYLVQTAFASLKSQQLSLKQLLEISPTEQSPFINDLRSLLGYLQKSTELGAAYREVVTQNQPVRLKSNHTFKLDCLGLVRVEKDCCRPRCDLYRQYFSHRLNFQK